MISATLTLAGILFASMLNVGFCSKPWDVIIFSQNWPTSVCDQWMQGSGRTCREYPKDIWTVHGVWPTLSGTKGPSYCEHSPFNGNAMKSIESELDYYWTPIHVQGPKSNFWSHEWTKHGTCALSVPQLNSQAKYFEQGLKWAKQYNMANILGAAGIVPGREYTFQHIRNGIKQVVKKEPQIECYRNRDRRTVLNEVRFCFDKSLELVDCQGSTVREENGNHLTNCRSNWILYPKAN